MSSRVRSLARSKARFGMNQEGRRIFGWYTTVETPVRNKRTGKVQLVNVKKSLFSKAWRDYAR